MVVFLCILIYYLKYLNRKLIRALVVNYIGYRLHKFLWKYFNYPTVFLSLNNYYYTMYETNMTIHYTIERNWMKFTKSNNLKKNIFNYNKCCVLSK